MWNLCLDFILEDFNRARDLVFDDQTIGGMIVCDSSKQARELEKQLEERRKAGTTNLTSALILHDEGDKEEKRKRWMPIKKVRLTSLSSIRCS